ncbi:MAG: beta-lactamase family protein [Cyclobacteriaceae bacterium]|jgi:CubicO group peptidase (beta-lactamase class C family)|nr:beta-lactamase family protein [Cyclobacteriaceae bacterium]
MKKTVIRILWGTLVVALVYGVSYLWRALPIISGYGAKNLCSCVFVAGRDANEVISQELGNGMLAYGSYAIDRTDSSASGSVFGLAARKAIYREGLGCTLVADIDEKELRNVRVGTDKSKATQSDTLAWPLGDRLDSLSVPVDKSKLEDAIRFAFTETDTARPMNTRAVVVVYDGQLVAERYAPGYHAHSKHLGWSMTKSITNAIVGILSAQGKLDVNAPAPIEAWQTDARAKITWHNLLQASSGLAWEEDYGGPSKATNMLFKEKDMGHYAAQSPPQVEPNTVFEYSSGTTNILSMLVRQAIGEDDYYRFYQRELFEKIGAHSLVIEPDAGGTYVGSSYSWATARDWARFGLLYLNDGLFAGNRILPPGWVRYSTTPAQAAPRGEYGAQWWLNAGEKGNPGNRYYPDLPTDCFQAEGYDGQFVFVIPSRKLVVVRLGLSQKNELDMNAFVAKIIEALPADAP